MQNKDYPSILKLKELEANANMLLVSYDDSQVSYQQALSVKDTKKAKYWLNVMDKINAKLNTIISSISEIIYKIERSGIKYQDIATIDAKKINNISKKMNMKNKEIARMQNNLNTIEGEMNTSNKEQTSNYLQMSVMFITAIVIILLISKTAMTSEISSFSISLKS